MRRILILALVVLAGCGRGGPVGDSAESPLYLNLGNASFVDLVRSDNACGAGSFGQDFAGAAGTSRQAVARELEVVSSYTGAMNHVESVPERATLLDQRLVAVARGVKVLSELAWPVDAAERFLQAWRRGDASLPATDVVPADHSAAVGELCSIMDECDRQHPIEEFLYRTARSYRLACELLDAAGTPEFGARSRALYGDPSQPITGGETSSVDAAKHVMQATAPFAGSCRLEEQDYCIMPETVAAEMRRHAATFEDDQIEVTVDVALSSKAAAGARRIRIRGATSFSEADLPQLVQHELFVHTLTALNGRRQPQLGSLGLGAPRTTRTQEGLALFAELITNSMDINRLRRVAARPVAIDMALSGADFIEVFRYFLEVGQTESEAFASTQRVFRGAPVDGGSAFTKDGVYFQGLVRVHRFLRDAAREGRIDDPLRLMAGRMRTGDVARLAPWFDSGAIAPARYLPAWIRTRSRMIAFLMYSSFAAELHLDSLIAPRETADSGE